MRSARTVIEPQLAGAETICGLDFTTGLPAYRQFNGQKSRLIKEKTWSQKGCSLCPAALDIWCISQRVADWGNFPICRSNDVNSSKQVVPLLRLRTTWTEKANKWISFLFSPPLHPPQIFHRHKQSGIDTNSTELQTFCVCPKRINALPDAGLAHTHAQLHILSKHICIEILLQQANKQAKGRRTARRGGVKQSTCTGRGKQRGGWGVIKRCNCRNVARRGVTHKITQKREQRNFNVVQKQKNSKLHWEKQRQESVASKLRIVEIRNLHALRLRSRWSYSYISIYTYHIIDLHHFNWVIDGGNAQTIDAAFISCSVYKHSSCLCAHLEYSGWAHCEFRQLHHGRKEGRKRKEKRNATPTERHIKICQFENRVHVSQSGFVSVAPVAGRAVAWHPSSRWRHAKRRRVTQSRHRLRASSMDECDRHPTNTCINARGCGCMTDCLSRSLCLCLCL